MPGKMNVVDEYEAGQFSERFVTVLSEIFLTEWLVDSYLEGWVKKRREKMGKHWFDRFLQKNDYGALPYYEEELNRARKALEEINQF